jgi:hypothetical protein
MKNFNLSNLLIPLLAAVAIYLPWSGVLSPAEEPSSAAAPLAGIVQLAPPPTPGPTPTPKPGEVEGEAAKLLCDFFGGKPVQDQPPKDDQRKSPPSSEADRYKGNYCRIKPGGQRADYEIEYLMAMVPDPKDSPLDHLFDRNLSVIQRAAADAGYVFDRYSLPWEKAKPTTPLILTTANSPAQTTPRHAREPGVILFRKFEKQVEKSGEKTKPKLLLVFLVGETPTGGIHRAAFQSALRQIEQLDGWKESNPPPPVTLRMLGPTFSGSADSLAILLKAWLPEYEPPLARPKVRIASGSATSIDKGDFLKKIGQPEGTVGFYSTVINSGEMTKAVIEYLSRNDSRIGDEDKRAHPQIAWLSEASTAYGQRIREQIGAGAPAPSPTPAAERLPAILSLTFPLHISQLRVEAAKSKPSRNDATKPMTVNDEHLPLPMSEGGAPGSRDAIPPFSALETVTVELVLGEILSAINRERIRYIVLSTTDVQDRIFLAREIRNHCPNAVIVTFSSDLLYLHAEANLDLQGTLVISPYPLFGLNQLWTWPFDGDQRRLQFTTPSAQGIYNATLWLLGQPDRMLEYGKPFETYLNRKTRHPVLWLGIVGRNGIWPVKTFGVGIPLKKEDSYLLPVQFEEGSKDAKLASEIQQGKAAGPRLGLSGNYYSAMGVGLLLVIGFACLLPAAVLLAQLTLFRLFRWQEETSLSREQPEPSRFHRAIGWLARKLESGAEGAGEGGLLRWIRRGRLGQVFGDEKFYRYRLDRRVYLMACCISLLIVALFISGVAVLPGWMKTEGTLIGDEWGQHRLIRLAAYAILASTLSAFVWLVVSIASWMIGGARDFRGYPQALLALTVGVAMIAVVGLGLIEIFGQPSLENQVFFFLRATELTSGVSLLLPALLIGLAMFLSFLAGVRRLNLAERMPCLPGPQQQIGEAEQFLRFDHGQAKSFAGLKALEDRVKDLIVCPVFGVRCAKLAAILTFIVYFRLFLYHFIPSVDGRWFDLYFEVAFYLSPLLLVWAFLRLFWLWAALRKLLRRLSWHPLFSQYAATLSDEKRLATLPRIDLMTPAPTFTALSASARQARQFFRGLKLSPEMSRTKQRIRQLVEEAETGLSLALHFDSQGHWQEAVQNRYRSQAALAELTEPVTALLEDSWQTPNGEEAKAGSWQSEGRFFLLVHVAAFLQYIFAHLQNLVALVTAGLLLLLLAANSYPFQPREPLLLFSWVTILAAVALTLVIFVQMSRDKVLSLLAGTTPGKLTVTRDFVLRVLIHGVIPIVALLGAQFPSALRQIFSWLSIFEGKGN